MTITKEAKEITNDEGGIYSNFDHILNQEIKEKLQNNPNVTFSCHSAWDFCGYIWYEGNKWKEEIWRYNSLVEILEADTIEDLIEEAISEYGRG